MEDVEPEALHLAAPAVEGRVVDPQGLAGGPHDELPGERNAAHPEATEGNTLGQDRRLLSARLVDKQKAARPFPTEPGFFQVSLHLAETTS